MNYKIDHIGYLTKNIDCTAKEFEHLGYEKGKSVLDDIQRARICFLTKKGEVDIELVEPYEDNKTMQKMLAKQRCTIPYHTCYEVDDLEQTVEEFIKYNWTALFEPVPAPALNNRKICYFYKREIGYIEIVNRQ